MKISYNWLKDYLDLTMDPYKLAEALSLRGLDVEEVIENRLDFPNVVVGKVISSKQHPNADKLKVCKVDVGNQQLAIVCGAPNVAAGQLVPVAKEGAELPNGLKIRKTKIRGEISEGMICSEQELGLAEKSDGIWVLPDNLPIGQPLHKALSFETDYIFDIAITPNRPDCLSHIGVAREVAAIIGQKIKKPIIKIKELPKPVNKEVTIRIDCPESCPRYTARIIRNIKVGASPSWLVRRLEAAGMRSINNVVDVTNYVMLETGQPLHAFDLDLIKGNQIIVRESIEGEKFITLDGVERTLKAETVLICDAERPVAIGGIMGGLNSEVNQSTTNVLLESAYFQPESIQRSARHLGLSTEASQRFERGVDPNGVCYASNRAAQLIAELCGGEIYEGIVDIYPQPIEPKKVPLKIDQINNLLGTHLKRDKIIQILESIDLKVQDNYLIAPTFRPDLERVADIAEEVARLYGLDNIPAKEKITIYYNISRNELDAFVDELKTILTGIGLQEVITPSMINSEVWSHLTHEKIYPILNPISKDMDGLRNTLIPSLAQVVVHNLNRQIKDLRLFEINRVFITPKSLQVPPVEELHLGMAVCGKREGDLWYSSQQYTDFYDIKGILEVFFSKISLDNWQFISYSHSAIQGDGLGIKVGDTEIGFCGLLSDKIKQHFEIDEDVFIAELKVKNLFDYRRTDKKYKPIPRFPFIDRDIAFIVDESIEAASLEEVIWKNGGEFLQEVEVFDIFRGKQIPEGKKSIAFRMIFQSPERTLTEEEVNQVITKIINAVLKSHKAKLRE